MVDASQACHADAACIPTVDIAMLAARGDRKRGQPTTREIQTHLTASFFRDSLFSFGRCFV
uniref:Uncharacterized protein n=1 Tax=Burkholderia sp. (strain CCGE1003) TaxID=640512 RepID=E1TGX7_BURSG